MSPHLNLFLSQINMLVQFFMTRDMIKSFPRLSCHLLAHFKIIHVVSNYFHMSRDETTYFFFYDVNQECGIFLSYNKKARSLWIT